MKQFIEKNELEVLLQNNGYEYYIERNILHLKEKNKAVIPCATSMWVISRPYNDIYEAISKCKEINILDFTDSDGIPSYFCKFPFLEEVRIGEKIALPIFKDCPRLSRVTFVSEKIQSIDSHSFEGWPHINRLILGEKLAVINSFSLTNADISVLDLSQTKLKWLNEHAFQYSKFEKIILPYGIEVLPEYVFFGCQNLKEIVGEGIKEVKWKAFAECPNLSFLKFNEDINYESVHRAINGNSSSEDYFLSRCGIIIYNDEYFSYIWCFTDFRFYYAERQDDSLYLKIVHFNRSNNKTINDIGNGIFSISSTYSEYYAERIQLDGFMATSKVYNKIAITGDKNIDLQREAIILYENLQKNPPKPIKQKIAEFELLVDSLNIDDIISSYETKVDEYVITKVGGDDRFYSEITKGTNYSDPYIDTLLPKQNTSYSDSGYTSKWPWTSKEEKEKFKKEDDFFKTKARKTYNKEIHKNYLIDKYIETLVNNRVEIEEYLHINFATRIFQNSKDTLYGFSKVFKLNMILRVINKNGNF